MNARILRIKRVNFNTKPIVMDLEHVSPWIAYAFVMIITFPLEKSDEYQFMIFGS
jgi:hypothetical protein